MIVLGNGAQSLALRGHENNDGNFKQHLDEKAETDPNLVSCLQRNNSYTSPECQNKLLKLMSNSITRQTTTAIHSLPVLQFSLIMDGTQDISGTEQISIRLRYVNEGLEPLEDFVGLYEASSTTGEYLFKITSDVLLRLNLPFSGLRGQTYDGAANMSGHLSGTQALIQRQQPLANFVHCGPHCVNLVTGYLYIHTGDQGCAAVDKRAGMLIFIVWEIEDCFQKYCEVTLWFLHLHQTSVCHQMDCSHPSHHSSPHPI